LGDQIAALLVLDVSGFAVKGVIGELDLVVQGIILASQVVVGIVFIVY